MRYVNGPSHTGGETALCAYPLRSREDKVNDLDFRS